MKTAVLTGLRQFHIQDSPSPELVNPHDVLIQINEVGVCGSDVHYFETGRIGDQVVEFPWIVGHESAGTVLAVGSDVADLIPGDRVAIDPAVACGQCDQCRRGRENTCLNLKFLACPGQLPGSLCQHLVMPATSCFKLPDNVSITQGVLSEPLAIAAHAVFQAKIAPGQAVAILGAGPIGLSCLLCAQSQGAKDCYVTDLIDARLEHARNQGAKWAGNPNKVDAVAAVQANAPLGVDVVFECAGEQATIKQAVQILRPGGTLAMIGIPRVDHIQMPIHAMRRKEITFLNIRRQNQCTGTVLEWIAQEKIHPDFMATHCFTLDQTQQAFELAAAYADGVIKAIIKLS